MSDNPIGFVALKSLTQGPPDAKAALAEIRRIYFKTTKQTIEHDFAHAIELLKSLPSDEEREKATVFMQGLAQMQRDWERKEKRKGAPSKPAKAKNAAAAPAASGSKPANQKRPKPPRPQRPDDRRSRS